MDAAAVAPRFLALAGAATEGVVKVHLLGELLLVERELLDVGRHVGDQVGDEPRQEETRVLQTHTDLTYTDVL